ncbi:nuclear transport factor 2 family protein [Halorarum halophilum]|uniref:Nuclear transport factor 2 family protein n=1 Tax=Halorarum halophilum TaxID=2743090 RepID=A0A7D5GLI6_9EURY|nr:nuclear transport factor 2 family protein [Halobaculum halophilum]QLG28047.1 nuclear transport factor 2 family protein [Halobaculum halophilum]
MSAEETARRYYETIDGDDYESLAALLRPEFTHYRPDRTLAGRETFVRFMREERPRTDTIHAIDAVYRDVDDVESIAGDNDDEAESDEVAVRGRLRAEDGRELFGFVDVFVFEGDAVAELITYTGSLEDR